MTPGTRLTVDGDGRLTVHDGEGTFPITVTAEGCTLRVGVQESLETPLVDLEPGDDDAFEADWPEDFPGEFCLLRIWRLQDDGAPLAAPPITLERPGQAPERSTRLGWVSDEAHAPFAIKVIEYEEGRPTTDFRTVLREPCHLPWTSLDGTSPYRVIVREHDGLEFVRRVVDLELAPDATGTYPTGVEDAEPHLLALDAALGAHAPPPAGLLGLTDATDGDALAKRLSDIVHRRTEVTPRIFARPGALDFAGITTAARQMAETPGSSQDIGDVLAYLALMGVVDAFFQEHGLRDELFLDSTFDAAQAAAMRGALAASPAYVEGSFAAHLVAAWAWSLHDRERAAAAIASARAANPVLFELLWVETGASSYVSATTIGERTAAAQTMRDQVEPSLRFVTEMPRHVDGEVMYACSCDPRYFRIYFPTWLAIAEYLKARQVRMHFLLCTEPAAADELIARARGLAAQEGRMRDFDPATYADNISFSTAIVPDGIPEARTYHASSRFLLANQLLEAHQGPLLLSDIDMWFRHDPRAYLALLDFTRLGLTAKSGLESMRPWRRYIANTVVLPFSEVGRAAIQHLETYLYAALGLPRTWMLDQNALAYMVERLVDEGHRESIVGIDGLTRPTESMPVKLLLNEAQPR